MIMPVSNNKNIEADKVFFLEFDNSFYLLVLFKKYPIKFLCFMRTLKLNEHDF